MPVQITFQLLKYLIDTHFFPPKAKAVFCTPKGAVSFHPYPGTDSEGGISSVICKEELEPQKG